MSEGMIIENCAPTLAGIKTGNLFSVRSANEADITDEVRKLNASLRKKGIRVIPLKTTGDFALIYIYRPDFLEQDLRDSHAKRILNNFGYLYKTPEGCILHLIERLKNTENFPHEIGLFLGYPPADVEGFMKHPCEGVQCCGYWKVYAEPEKAQMTFRRYRQCTEAYCRMNQQGRTLVELTVNTTKIEKLNDQG